MNTDENNNNYQYDRCTSRGICSINPTTAALQEIVIMYLKSIAFYGAKLEELSICEQKIYNIILNTISILCSNSEISEYNFNTINMAFRHEFPLIRKLYKKACTKNNIKPADCSHEYVLNENRNINEFIRLGEQEFNATRKKFSKDIVILYKILFRIIKSISLNILTYKSYEQDVSSETSYIIKLLNILNNDNYNNKMLKDILLEASEKDCKLLEKIRHIQTQYYGEQTEKSVSFSTEKGKAILVVGSNLRELEQILDVFKGKNISVYSHDNMLLAHTFPKFQEYQYFKGHYGQGMENCLPDFSTFPGPIILTRHSLFNIEDLYRGRLYTTDISHSNGVIRIENDNFDKVVQAAQESKGFKTGKICKPELVGFQYSQAFEQIKEHISNKTYSDVILYGTKGFNQEEEEYFKSLIKNIPSNVLLISLTCCENKDNILCFNAIADNCALLKFSEYIINLNLTKVNIFVPYCDRHTLSVLLNLYNSEAKIYLGTWNKTILKPDILEELTKTFNISELSSPKQDLSNIINSH